MPSVNDPHIIVTESDGTATDFLLRAGTPIARGPITGLGQIVTTGDTAERADQRTPQVIWAGPDHPVGGMGQFWYEEVNGVGSFNDSTCETRYPGLVVLPPARTSLGLMGSTPNIPIVEYVGQTNCKIVVWCQGNVQMTYYNPITPGWVNVAAITYVSGFCRFNAKYILVRNPPAGSTDLYHSTDGVTWTGVVTRVKQLAGCCVHDNKLYSFNATDNKLEWATDPTVADAAYLQSTVLNLDPGEVVYQIFEWRVGNVAYVFLLSNMRLLWYNEDADQFIQFDDTWRGLVGTTNLFPRATISPSSGNLYLTLFNNVRQDMGDLVLWYAGTRNITGPNRKGGLPSASRVTVRQVLAAYHWLYGVGRPRVGTTNAGRMLALNDQDGWHTLGVGDSSSAYVAGGGYAIGTLWTVMQDRTVYEQSVPDVPDLPIFATVGERTYPTSGTYQHEVAFTDGGTPNMDKQWLWVTVRCLDHTADNKVPGLATNTSVLVEYRSDTDTAWTSLSTLTSANTFPKVLSIASGFGIRAKQFKVRLTLASTTTNNTPVVASVAAAYVRQEVPRYNYDCALDLAFRDHPLYAGKDVGQLQAALDRYTQPGKLVKLQFAGGDAASAPPTATTVANCTVAYSGTDDPLTGPLYRSVVFSDFSPPADG